MQHEDVSLAGAGPVVPLPYDHPWNQLLPKIRPSVAVFVRSLTKGGRLSAQKAEGIVQDAFVRALERWQVLEILDDGEFLRWLKGAALNVRRERRAIRWFRRRVHADLDALAAATPREAAELALRLWALLERLPEDTRSMLLDALVEDLPWKDVAQAAGIEPEAARKRCERAQALLRDLLLRDPGASGGAPPPASGDPSGHSSPG